MKDAIEWLEQRDRVDDLALFLDFDGTLAPIVDRPDEARPLDGITELVEAIGARIPVAVISGRGLEDVQRRLGASNIHYAGSHGMEIRAPGGPAEADERVENLLSALDEHERRLRERFAEVPKVEIERKRFGVAVHFRRHPEAQEIVEKALDEAIEDSRDFKMSTGKMVRELQPDVELNKGTALLSIRDRIDEHHRRFPIYVGDDTTDEDAFSVLTDKGAGILVADQSRSTEAKYQLRDPEQVRYFLHRLARLLAENGDEG